ncbi:MAG TPA: VWA domain-containing protein [Pyrinomonadaceae bacterium]|nr:VWA domain-containing protein [Pyrinomonadaceae bacterium]
MKRTHLLSAVFLLALCGAVRAQAGAQAGPSPSPTPVPGSNVRPEAEDEIGEGEVLRITANLVSVPVMVIDRRGQYVVDLQQKDFRIFEDGEEQVIAHFSNVDRPFSVALLIDTSGSTSPFLNQIKDSAKAFVAQLRPSDLVRPIYFHGEIRSLTRAGSNDAPTLDSAIDQMEAGPLLLGTRLYDAVDYGLGVLKADAGRKAIIVFSDGENTWGKASAKSTLESAEESGTIIYTLQYGDGPVNKYLQQLAARTGGRYFKAGGINQINQSFAGVADELRRQYWIGYYPKDSSSKSRERLIKVKVNRERLAVRARRSYIYQP